MASRIFNQYFENQKIKLKIAQTLMKKEKNGFFSMRFIVCNDWRIYLKRVFFNYFYLYIYPNKVPISISI